MRLHSRKVRLLAAFFPLILLPGWSGSAQDAAFGERIEVELVDVEVIVTDRDGAIVSGLEAADFTIFEDDLEVPVKHFTRFGRVEESLDKG